jgi:tripartite-type tricarboxylate transporter receptor subunit TctC
LPAVSYSTWFGFFAPKGTPREIISRLNAAAVEALADPAVRSRLIDLGLEIFSRERQTPEALGALQRPTRRNGGRSSRSLALRRSEP